MQIIGISSFLVAILIGVIGITSIILQKSGIIKPEDFERRC